MSAVDTALVDVLGANWPVVAVAMALLWTALRELGPGRRLGRRIR